MNHYVYMCHVVVQLMSILGEIRLGGVISWFVVFIYRIGVQVLVCVLSLECDEL